MSSCSSLQQSREAYFPQKVFLSIDFMVHFWESAYWKVEISKVILLKFSVFHYCKKAYRLICSLVIISQHCLEKKRGWARAKQDSAEFMSGGLGFEGKRLLDGSRLWVSVSSASHVHMAVFPLSEPNATLVRPFSVPHFPLTSYPPCPVWYFNRPTCLHLEDKITLLSLHQYNIMTFCWKTTSRCPLE